MISLIQICDYSDFVDGQCPTTTTAAPETTTTAVSEDIGELIIIYDAEDEMAQESFPLHPLRFLMIFTLVKSTIPGKKNYPKIFIFRTFRVVFRIFLKSSKSD